MNNNAKTVDEYINQLPKDRALVVKKMCETIRENIPNGFSECISYNMIGYVVPLTIYPEGYHVGKNTPLPFLNIASQKNYIALYHMGLYANKELLKWFEIEYTKHCKYKLDMGKSCIRFKRLDDIPYDLIAELIQQMSVEKWIALYEKNVPKNMLKK